MVNKSAVVFVSRALTVIALLVSAACSSAFTHKAGGQEYGLPVRVYACDANVEIPGSGQGEPLPEECRRLSDVRITAYTEDGIELDSCITDRHPHRGYEAGYCELDLGPNGLRIYEMATSAIPEGYHARANVIRQFTYTEFAEIVFVNYRDDVLPGPETGDATLRIHSRVCPDGYAGDAFYQDCHDTVPAQSQWVFANRAYTATGADGNAVFRNLPAGKTQVYAGQTEQTGDVFFYCSETDALDVRRETTTAVVIEIDDTRHLRGTLTLNPGDDITCDWYVIPRPDRHLWSTVEHWLADDEPDVTYHGGSGEIELRLFRCPEGYAGQDHGADCTAREDFALVRATSSDGHEYDVATTNKDGFGTISLSGFPVTNYWITLDGHASIDRDNISCVSNSPNFPILVQQVTRTADRWNIATFGDDPGGAICNWFLVPTE